MYYLKRGGYSTIAAYLHATEMALVVLFNCFPTASTLFLFFLPEVFFYLWCTSTVNSLVLYSVSPSNVRYAIPYFV